MTNPQSAPTALTESARLAGMRQWVTDLRSGAYPQTTECLRSFEGYCCLGVRADRLAPKGWAPIPYSSEYEFRLPGYPGIMNGFMNTRSLAAADLTDTQQHDLSALNDGGATFDEIATYIEQEIM